MPGESLTSLIRQTAHAMGYGKMYPLRLLIGDCSSLVATMDYLSPGPAMERISQLLDRSTEELLSLTVHQYAPRLVLRPRGEASARLCDLKTRGKYFSLQLSPVCPRCFQTDTSPYDRLLWSCRGLPICTEHGILLVSQCSGCGRHIRPRRDKVDRCRCGQPFEDMETGRLTPRATARMRAVEHWLTHGEVPIPELTTPAFLWWAEKLTTAVKKTPNWLQRTRDELDLQPTVMPEAVAWLATADMALNWPDRLYEFLDAFQQVDKYHHTDTGLSRRFGSLLRYAAHLDRWGHPEPADALRRYLLERYSGGHVTSKCCLFRDPEQQTRLSEREWISLTNAAKQLKLDTGEVIGLVRKGSLVGYVRKAGRTGRAMGIVSRQSIERSLPRVESLLGTFQAGEMLGIGQTTVRRMIYADLLPNAVRSPTGAWQIPQESVTHLLEWYQQLPANQTANARWLPAKQATRVFGRIGLTLVTLLRLLLDGRVQARRTRGHRNLDGLLVLKIDVENELVHMCPELSLKTTFPLYELAKILLPGRPTKERVLKKWIELGLLKATRAKRALVVTESEVQHFRKTYCLTDEASRQLGVVPNTLCRWQAEGKIQPVYGRRVTPGAGFTLYRRQDVLRLQEDIETARSRRKGIS